MAMANAENISELSRNFTQLPVVRQLGLMFGLAASVALGVAVVLWSQEPTYGVLFGGMGQKESSQVMELLQQRGIDYKLDDRTGALMVPASRLHEIRLQLASEGLPRSSGGGLEILQQKQEFGTSQFMETARYRHALEAELARSIETISSVQSARVHLATPKQSVFVRKQQQPSASVMINLYPGRTLEAGQVAAITHMVASSIPNLEPQRVTVVDQRGQLLSQRQRSAELEASDEQFSYTRRVEDSYVRRIESILTPLVGMDGVRAQVAADMDFTVTEKTEETYNPDLPALRSEQITEEETTNGGIQGVPGALSNQPPGAGEAPEVAPGVQGEGSGGKPVNSRRSSTANYELDRTIAHTKLATGVVKRLSIAVVVNHRAGLDAEGNPISEPRSPEELERLTSLVREAVGYSAARGDTVNVINAAFDGLTPIEPLPEPPLWEQPWVLDIAKMVLGTIVVLFLLLGVLRPVLRSLVAVREEADEGEAGALVAAGAGAHGGGAAGGLAEDQLHLSGPMEGQVKLPGPDAYEENIKLVQGVVKDDPKLVAQVVKTWLAED